MFLGLAIPTIAAFVACSNTAPKETGKAGLDACALLSKEAVSSILGTAFGDPNNQIRRDDNGKVIMASCTFVPIEETSFSSLNLLITLQADNVSPSQAIQNHVHSLKRGMGNDDGSLVTVEGLGEAAGYDPTVGQMFVFDNDRLLVLTLHHQPKNQTKALLIELARETLSD
jgi:hypothetical protein